MHDRSQLNTTTQTAADVKYESALIQRHFIFTYECNEMTPSTSTPCPSYLQPCASVSCEWAWFSAASCSLTEQTWQIQIIFSNHSLSCLRFGFILPNWLIQPCSAGPCTGSSSFRIRALIAATRVTSGFWAGCAQRVVGLGEVGLAPCWKNNILD